MAAHDYVPFCPTIMAADLIEPRWTMLLISEMGSGSTRFSDIQRGVPGMSPSLLSRRLKELEQNGLVRREQVPETGQWRYHLTPMAEELVPLIDALGDWAHRNLCPNLEAGRLDHRLLMWNVRRKLKTSALPARRVVVQFRLETEGQPVKDYWLIAKPGAETDLCSIDPQFDVDLYVTADLAAFTAAWMGPSRIESEIEKGAIVLVGDAEISRSITQWMVRSRFADDPAAAAPGRRLRRA